MHPMGSKPPYFFFLGGGVENLGAILPVELGHILDVLFLDLTLKTSFYVPDPRWVENERGSERIRKVMFNLEFLRGCTWMSQEGRIKGEVGSVGYNIPILYPYIISI